mmetsp:Transcript_158016/g.291390  ORF Transcript_158016/g.291390 Transcript_158016/m.291390 type:complete len:979 (-) Transcript_158016:93-3029(-)
MGQTHSSGTFFREVSVKDHFASIQTLWSEDDLESLLDRLKTMTLNFSLDRVKFSKLLQLSSSFEALVAKWFEEFSHDRASQVVDGLEFLSASIMISSKVPLFRKICLLFSLFDLDKTGCIRRDEFTIFLKAVTTGLHRMLSGLPPPATVMELGGLSTEFFSTLAHEVLSKHDFLTWMTEAHYSLHYLSVLSKLGSTVFAWGTNHRFQLGLNLEPKVQRVPAPVLNLEGISIASVASNESHCLFLTADGRVWSCGSGFCGILGHGNIMDCPQPQLVESLAHVRIVDVAVGVRHSVAVSDKGQVFTWGAADLGQLGHGSTEDREVFEWAYDPKTGSTFAYVTKPTVVMALFGKKIFARKASCCNFSTIVLTDQGHIYSWGNNTDGQCGQGQKCPDHKLIYIDPHMHRTAMQCIIAPRRLEASVTFRDVTCGGYHVLAVDVDDRLWTWGQGLWGKLGHGDQRSMYEPRMVDALKHHICQAVAAGETHSLCLLSLFRLTITGTSTTVPLAPFSLLGLPAGRVDRLAMSRMPVTPPNTSLQLNAFASSKLLQVGLPFRHDPEIPILNPEQYSPAEIQSSIILMDRALWEGEWLKLATTDFDFNVLMSSTGAPLPSRTGISGSILFAAEGRGWELEDCAGKVCIFELREGLTPPEIQSLVLQLASECQKGNGLACLCVLPKKVEKFDVIAGSAALSSIAYGVMGYEHGVALKKHITRLINIRIAEAPDGLPDDMRDWRETRAEFTGKLYYENVRTGAKRWAPPQINPGTEACLLSIKEDCFLQRLRAVLDLQPKGIIVCQQSWKPDVELLTLPEAGFDLENLNTPIVLVTYEAGEELKGVVANQSEPWVTMEIQPSGGVCAWGNCTSGQLGLSGIENQNFLTITKNALTGEENAFVNRPYYVAHLHEHQVSDVACGAAHTVAVTQQGEVFTWGVADSLGVPLNKPSGEVPMFVEQLEGLVKATKAFGGYHHSFVVADMPFKAVV